MTIGSYQISGGKTLWYFVIDLPIGDDGKRRQHKTAWLSDRCRSRESGRRRAGRVWGGGDRRGRQRRGGTGRVAFRA